MNLSLDSGHLEQIWSSISNGGFVRKVQNKEVKLIEGSAGAAAGWKIYKWIMSYSKEGKYGFK